MAHTIASFDEGLLCLILDKLNNEEAKTIIEKEYLYNVTDSMENTLLHVAAETNAEITRYLINSGSIIDAENVLGQTPLMLAINANCSETFQVLLEAGANTELQNGLVNSLLHLFRTRRYVDEEILRVFLQKLRSVCSNNKEEIATKLIHAHWPLQRVVELKDSDLTRTVLQRKREGVKALLEYKAKVNIADKDNGQSPVCYLYDGRADRLDERLEILKMLLGRGAKICCNPGDKYESYKIFKYANGEAIKLLLQFDIDNSTDFDKLAALENLAENENPSIIVDIHGEGFDVNARHMHGRTLLMTVASCGDTSVVEFLLNVGADIDAVDDKNSPAIFHAVRKHPKCEQCVQLLLERRADVQNEVVTPLRGQPRTIIDLIRRRRLFWLVELVVEHQALQEILEKDIAETICTQINSCERFKIHFESSKQQLLMQIYESTTLLDLLTLTTDEKFEMYARNEEFILKTQDAISAMSGHRYFRKILKRRLSKAQTTTALKTAAAQIISKIIGMSYERFPLIADYIVSYLDHEDMKNLEKISC